MFKKKNLMVVCFLVIFLIGITLPLAAVEIKVQTPSIPAAIPFLWMEAQGDLPEAVDLKLNLSADHQRGISLLAENEIDFLITGSNLGANAYNRGLEIKMINVNTWGIDYLLTNDFKADQWQDLKGKSLVLPLKGGPLDFLTRYLAAENGLDPDQDLKLFYRALPGSAQLFMKGDLDAILLPEPLVTISLAKSKRAVLSLDIQKEWAKIHGDPRIPFVALFGNSNFIEEYPQFTKIINGYYKKGVEWTNNNQEAAASLATEHFAIPEALLQKSLTRVHLEIYPDQESRKLTELYFGEMLSFFPELLAGTIPDEKFYY